MQRGGRVAVGAGHLEPGFGPTQVVAPQQQGGVLLLLLPLPLQRLHQPGFVLGVVGGIGVELPQQLAFVSYIVAGLGVVGQVNVLKGAQPLRHQIRLHRRRQHRNHPLIQRQRLGQLLLAVGRLGRMGRQQKDNVIGLFDALADGAVVVLTGLNVGTVVPHGDAPAQQGSPNLLSRGLVLVAVAQKHLGHQVVGVFGALGNEFAVQVAGGAGQRFPIGKAGLQPGFGGLAIGAHQQVAGLAVVSLPRQGLGEQSGVLVHVGANVGLLLTSLFVTAMQDAAQSVEE